MEADFWHDRWEAGQIGFHEAAVNPLLVEHVSTLNLPKGARIFLPLCGKTHDIAWLLAKGYHVLGAELSAMAVDQLFVDLGVTPTREQLGSITHLSADHIDIYVGDIFDVTAQMLGPVTAVYDRAALVALPDKMRQKYAIHLATITDTAPQLLLTFQYDQSLLNGPPFSVTEDMVLALYDAQYGLEQLAHWPVDGGMKGQPATEEVWLLRRIP